MSPRYRRSITVRVASCATRRRLLSGRRAPRGHPVLRQPRRQPLDRSQPKLGLRLPCRRHAHRHHNTHRYTHSRIDRESPLVRRLPCPLPPAMRRPRRRYGAFAGSMLPQCSAACSVCIRRADGLTWALHKCVVCRGRAITYSDREAILSPSDCPVWGGCGLPGDQGPDMICN